MQKGSETAFLKKRKGFIRIAMQNGSAVVPCFAFGQSGVYHWFRPGPPFVSDAFVQAVSRRIGKCSRKCETCVLQSHTFTMSYQSIRLQQPPGTARLALSEEC